MIKPSELLFRAAGALGEPGETAAGAPQVTVTGTGRLRVENHRGLVDYSEEELTLAAAGFLLRVRGEGLELLAMTDLELVVTGSIRSLEYML